jgi:hypothetical protein
VPTDVIRYYQLDGVVFRVRLDRLDRGAEYLRHERWVWTPITSEAVARDPRSREIGAAEARAHSRDPVVSAPEPD